jgi:hypothetical protein
MKETWKSKRTSKTKFALTDTDVLFLEGKKRIDNKTSS